MNCAWENTWYGSVIHHNWFSGSLILLLAAVATAWFLLFLQKKQKKQKKTCPACSSPVEDVFLRCPDCGHALKGHCPHCSRIVETGWQFCPHCKEELTSVSVSKPTTGISPA